MTSRAGTSPIRPRRLRGRLEAVVAWRCEAMGMPMGIHTPAGDSDVSRRCVRCDRALRVTPEDELFCPLCGRVRAWTVTINGRVVAAGRSSMRGGISIWLAGSLDDLRPGSVREPARSCSGWNEES